MLRIWDRKAASTSIRSPRQCGYPRLAPSASGCLLIFYQPGVTRPRRRNAEGPGEFGRLAEALGEAEPASDGGADRVDTPYGGASRLERVHAAVSAAPDGAPNK